MGEGAFGATGLIGLHGLFYGTLAWVFAPVPLAAAVLGLLLIAVSVVDIRRFEIPDSFSALLVATGALHLWVAGLPGPGHVVAGLGFAALLYGVGVFYLRFRGHPGLGFGDVKLAAGLGLWLGIEGSVWALLAASLSGIAVLLVLAVLRQDMVQRLSASGVAFGPFLCLSAWAIWLQGSAV